MKQVISYLLIFVGIQLLGGAVFNALWPLINGNSDQTPIQLIVTTSVVSLVTIAVFLLTRWTQVSPRWLRTRQWSVLLWSVVAALGGAIPSMWLQEQIPELPNWVENEFTLILGSRWGYVAIGLLAPFAEEIVFRGAILKVLLEKLSPWTAIVLSALLFALIHLNPAQMPHAFLVGLLLGWMYKRTGSILPGIAYHWTNNSMAYVIYALFPDPHLKLVDLCGGSTQNELMAVGFSLLILLPALFQLHLWMRPADKS